MYYQYDPEDYGEEINVTVTELWHQPGEEGLERTYAAREIRTVRSGNLAQVVVSYLVF